MKKLDHFMHRAKDINTKELVSGFLTHDPIFNKAFIFHGILTEVDINTIGRNTEINDTNDDPIYEGDIVEQRAVLVGDNSETITGVVKMLEGAWQIVDEVNERSVMLWSEHRKNRIVEVE